MTARVRAVFTAVCDECGWSEVGPTPGEAHDWADEHNFDHHRAQDHSEAQ